MRGRVSLVRLVLLCWAATVCSWCLGLTVEERLHLLYQRVTDQIAAGKLDDALASAHKAVDIAPSSAFAWFLRGRVYRARGELAAASASLTRAIELNRKYAEAYCDRGLVYYQQGEYERAEGDFTRAIELRPRYADAYYYRGFACLGQGEFERAILDCTRGMELVPGDFGGYFCRGLAYLAQGEFERDQGDFTRAIELAPADPHAYAGRGIVCAIQGDGEQAVADLLQAVRLQPEEPLWRERLASCYAYQERWSEALAQAREAAARATPEDAASWSLPALLVLSGDVRGAEEVVPGAPAAAQPQENDARAAQALVLAALGQTEQARQVLGQIGGALLNAPFAEGINAVYLSFRAYAQLGETRAAAELARCGAQRWPKHPWSAQMRQFLQQHPQG